MAAFRSWRSPRTAGELRAREDGHFPAIRKRGYVPTDRDELWVCLQRSWKKFRITQYKIKPVREEP